MKISTDQLITACNNFAKDKETHKERLIIIGYLMFLEQKLSEYGGEIVIQPGINFGLVNETEH